jgi:MoaA/NifB/PqqE/SkfB family radical SAM enzyme
VDELNKIYIEPTNRCNLACVTCIRHSWNEPFGDMEWPVYQTLIDGIKDFPGPKTMAFAGLGEPLLHKRFPEMVRLAHERGIRTEMTSNAMLLTSALAEELIEAGLDQFTVSIDGTSNEAHGAVRPGASLGEIIQNVRNLYGWSEKKVVNRLDIESALGLTLSAPIKIGIEFVAMKRNIHELSALRDIAYQTRASFILVTNFLPYTADLQDEILYRWATSYEGQGWFQNPLWVLPRMEWNRETGEPLSKLMLSQPNLNYLEINQSQRNNYCPFVQSGSMAVAWHGGVSPCPPLLHSYTCFIMNREKYFRHCEFGGLPGQSLLAIWSNREYAAFRERVRKFDFSPCTDCGGCHLAEKNEEDCYGNPFPVCGDCLWARGVLRCA